MHESGRLNVLNEIWVNNNNDRLDSTKQIRGIHYFLYYKQVLAKSCNESIIKFIISIIM